MKEVVDCKRRDDHFSECNWVFVKLKPYRQYSARQQLHHKLGHRFFGPFQVLKRVGQVAYKLDLPASARIHPVFHISMLKRCIGKPENQIASLQLLDTSTNLEDKVPFAEGVML